MLDYNERYRIQNTLHTHVKDKAVQDIGKRMFTFMAVKWKLGREEVDDQMAIKLSYHDVNK